MGIVVVVAGSCKRAAVILPSIVAGRNEGRRGVGDRSCCRDT